MKLGKSPLDGMDPEYLQRASEQSEAEIRRRSLFRIPIYFVLYLAIVAVTPITRRYATEVQWLGCAILVLSILRVLLLLNWNPLSARGKGFWRTVFFSGFYFMAILWGAFCSLTIQFFELGWVSFFVILVTCGLVAGELSALCPSFPLLLKYLGLMLVPSAVSCFLFVKGISGTAMGVFFTVYFLFLIIQGRMQSNEYWSRLRENAQLLAIIDSVPGTLSWISSDLHYLGVNRRMAQLWKMKAEEFIGKRVGFLDPHSSMVSFAQSIFERSSDYAASEVQIRIDHQERFFFMFGQKYNYGTEAIILGLDMTERRESEKAVVFERAQRMFTARLANKGEVFHRISDGIQAPAHEISSLAKKGATDQVARLADRLGKILNAVKEMSQSALEEPTVQESPNTLLESTQLLFEETAKLEGVQLSVKSQLDESIVFEVRKGQILEVIVSLLTNALDAVRGVGKKEITIEAKLGEDSDTVEISVTDSGPGLAENVRERLFEPLFTTKTLGESTGTGLSISKEIVEHHGGSIYLDTKSSKTRFVISLPFQKV